MEFQDLIKRAREIKEVNAKLSEKEKAKPFTTNERAQGFVGDVGELMKLISAKNGYRNYENLDEKLAHELSDCLWSILVLADDLGVDLEKSFLETMNKIESRLNK